MDTLDKIPTSKLRGFSDHVLKITDNDKGELMNLVQYALLCVVPIVLLNKSIQTFIPDVNEEKGSLEIGVEVVTQMAILFVGMFFIHRVVTFIPTYSGVAYPDLNMVNVVLSFLVIVLSLQTRLGEKVSILAERVSDFFRGFMGMKKNKEIVVEEDGDAPAHQGSEADEIHDYETRQMGEPRVTMATQMSQHNQVPVMSNQGNYPERTPGASMQQHRTNPNFGMMHQEPMAANAVLGGSGFSSW